jgi:hypothetical protein
MSGEQVLQSHETMPQSARLHLGGIPVAFSQQFPQIAMGFVGCMSSLKVQRNIFYQAHECYIFKFKILAS